jgi:hypothetical protein
MATCIRYYSNKQTTFFCVCVWGGGHFWVSSLETSRVRISKSIRTFFKLMIVECVSTGGNNYNITPITKYNSKFVKICAVKKNPQFSLPYFYCSRYFLYQCILSFFTKYSTLQLITDYHTTYFHCIRDYHTPKYSITCNTNFKYG